MPAVDIGPLLTSPLQRNTLAAGLAWTAMVALSLGWNLYQEKQRIVTLAEVEAKTHLARDLALRRWATNHGGVYVPVKGATRPNPYLADVPERDVVTAGGRLLTLYNPATMLREIKASQSDLYGELARITAKKVLNPVDLPDEWEERALSIIETTKEDFSEVTVIKGEAYLRRMQPMIMEEGCMRCHAWTGIKVGDVRGATDVAIPLKRYASVSMEAGTRAAALHGGMWLLGLGFIGFTAIRSRRHGETQARHQELLRKLNRAVEQSGSGIMIADLRGTIEYVNPRFCQINGYGEEELIGRNPRILKSGETDPEVYRGMWATLAMGEEWRGEFKNRRKDGISYWCMETISPIRDKSGKITHFVAVIEDVSERKFAEATIHRLAFYDPLTELPNRRLLRQSLERAAAWSTRNGMGVALFYVDLDRFKTINDTLGHAAGDALLVAVGRRFRDCVREIDTLARLGGDEFAVVVGNVRSEQDAAAVAEKLVRELRIPVVIDGHELNVTASIGIALYPEDTEDIDTLVKNADTAMYQAKAEGKNTYRFFSRVPGSFSAEGLAIENGLRKAVERGELFLEYQPKMELATGRIYGMEALVRWQHPTLGRIPPVKFIPLAEEIGEIAAIGHWVLLTACRQTQRWRQAGHDLKVSVNLSALQFHQPDLLEAIAAALAEAGLPAHALELEITESTLVINPEQATRTLRSLRDLGIDISIDDFGTGYSSLGYLKAFPVTVLKIDRSFVDSLGGVRGDRTIVNAIIALAKSLELNVVAEGVENQEQMDILRELDCDAIQGYFLSRPLAPPDFEALMGREAR
jgi:diguanylate cyclase (GGDEF)-like protein/PAS domain S-box-containing protein